MVDLYMTEAGDLVLSSAGDLAKTDTHWRQSAQEILFRVSTEEGDFLLHPTLGASLSRLYGLPNSPQTAEFGIQIIKDAILRNGRFSPGQILINPVPTDHNKIRFDISLLSGGREQISISISQEL